MGGSSRISPVITLPANGTIFPTALTIGANGGQYGVGNSAEWSVLSNVRGDELAGPFRGNREAIVFCSGLIFFGGLAAGLLIASQPSKNVNQKDIGSLGAVGASAGAAWLLCIGLGNRLANVPH